MRGSFERGVKITDKWRKQREGQGPDWLSWTYLVTTLLCPLPWRRQTQVASPYSSHDDINILPDKQMCLQLSMKKVSVEM